MTGVVGVDVLGVGIVPSVGGVVLGAGIVVVPGLAPGPLGIGAGTTTRRQSSIRSALFVDRTPPSIQRPSPIVIGGTAWQCASGHAG